MDPIESLEGDLRFVRAAVASAGRSTTPAAIYYLWAAIGLVGCVLVDARPAWIPWYWGAAGPTGFVVSTYLGWRHARRAGQVATSDGWRYSLHWGGMLGAIALALLLPAGGIMPWAALNATILLILALGYFTAGVHLDRALLGVGVLMAAGVVVITIVSAYAWTVVGVVLAAALAIAGLRAGRRHEARA